MSKLKQIVDEIQKLNETLAKDPEKVNWTARPGLVMKQNAAKGRLKQLRDQYVALVRQNSLGIFLQGDRDAQEKFAQVSVQEAETLTVLADDLYQKLAASVEMTFGKTREFGRVQFDALHQGIVSVKKQLGIRDMPRLQYTKGKGVPDRAALVNHIREVVEKVVEQDLVKIAVNQQLNAVVLESQFGGTVLPVVVVGATPEEATVLGALFTQSTQIEIEGSQEPTPEYVVEQLQGVKKQLKKPSKNKTQAKTKETTEAPLSNESEQ